MQLPIAMRLPVARRSTRPARRLSRGPLALAGVPAALAAIGGMGETVLPVEGLLPGGEKKLLTAIHALEALILGGIHRTVA
jgi:hypothetical protein